MLRQRCPLVKRSETNVTLKTFSRFSPVWIIICALRVRFPENDLQQKSHMNGRSPLCEYMWVFKSHIPLNRIEHTWHEKFRVCSLLWYFRDFRLVYDFKHTLQVYTAACFCWLWLDLSFCDPWSSLHSYSCFRVSGCLSWPSTSFQDGKGVLWQSFSPERKKYCCKLI